VARDALPFEERLAGLDVTLGGGRSDGAGAGTNDEGGRDGQQHREADGES